MFSMWTAGIAAIGIILAGVMGILAMHLLAELSSSISAQAPIYLANFLGAGGSRLTFIYFLVGVLGMMLILAVVLKRFT